VQPDLERDPLSLKPLVAITALGVGLRLLLLLLVGELELQSDESNYVYLAIAWDHFGVYFDHHRYLWPPAYPWILSHLIDAFGAGALIAIKLLQVIASASIGLTTMLLAYRLGSMRAARLAGLAWVVYLPLAAFTHLLWNESLFLALWLPGLYQCLRVMQAGRPGQEEDLRVDQRLVVAGLCFAGALYLKEAPTYLIPAIALLLVPFAGGLGEGLRRASLVVGVTFVAVLPWCLRNLEVYGHFALAHSMGENAYNGLNEDYRNFDLIPVDVQRGRRSLPQIADTVVRRSFVDAPTDSGWSREERSGWSDDELVNTFDRSKASTSAGLAYMQEHPGWFVRSRIKKLADLVTPLSFFTRHQALGHYDETLLGGPLMRKLTSLWAVACPILVLLLGTAGLFALEDRRGQLLIGLVLSYTLATTMLVAMSRFRLPIVPLLIAMAAVLLTRRAPVRRPLTSAATLATWGALVLLWWVNWPEVWTIFSEMVWRAEA
jgi:hypothetical protein